MTDEQRAVLEAWAEERTREESFNESCRFAAGRGACGCRKCDRRRARTEALRAALAEVERLTRERDEARDEVARLSYVSRQDAAEARRAIGEALDARGELEHLRRVEAAARALLGWKLGACYEHLTPDEQALRRAIVGAP